MSSSHICLTNNVQFNAELPLHCDRSLVINIEGSPSHFNMQYIYCMCMYMYVYVYVHICVYIYVCIHLHVYIHIRLYVCADIFVLVCVYIYTTLYSTVWPLCMAIFLIKFCKIFMILGNNT